MSSIIKKNQFNDEKILSLEFSNPKKNNALSLNMLDELINILSDLKYIKKFNCISFSGANDGPFSPGADLEDIKKLISNNNISKYHLKMNQVIRYIKKINVPTVSLLKSYCFGAGLILAIQSDIIIADKNTKFCIPASKLKIEIPKKQLDNLKKKINNIFLKDILLSSRVFSASEAYNFNIISNIVDSNKFKNFTKEYLQLIASKDKITSNYYLKYI
jgi:enoyl-CoA hydratase/carnithine racemase